MSVYSRVAERLEIQRKTASVFLDISVRFYYGILKYNFKHFAQVSKGCIDSFIVFLILNGV